MKLKKEIIVLSLIILLAAILRLYELGSYPVSVSWDEAAIGYNAYSIALTQKDEYGNKMPLLFKSFQDYKLPGYIYTDAMLIKYFGLSNSTTRLPSAIFGTISIFAIYIIAKNLFNKKIALISAFLLSISPWALQMSRAAFEANASLSIILVAISFIFLGFKNRISAAISLPLLALSLYFYYFPRVFIPLFIPIFYFIYKKEINKNLKYYFIGAIIATLLSFPIIFTSFSKQGLKRVGEVSIFSEESIIENYVYASSIHKSPLSKLFLNRRLPIAYKSLHSYFSHFSPGFLFFGDDPNNRHRAGIHGNFYLFEIATISTGLFVLLKNRDKSKQILLAWLLIAPVPAAFAQEAPHSLRALLLLPPLAIISALGVNSLAKKNKSIILASFIVIVFFINYLFSYYVLYPSNNSLAWAYGYEKMFNKVKSTEGEYETVIVTGHFWKPYIFYLYFNKYDPTRYQSIENQKQIDKYKFGSTYWDNGEDLNEKEIDNLSFAKTLVVLSKQEYDNLKDKSRFKKIENIKDYSERNDVFLIGNWQ